MNWPDLPADSRRLVLSMLEHQAADWQENVDLLRRAGLSDGAAAIERAEASAEAFRAAVAVLESEPMSTNTGPASAVDRMLSVLADGLSELTPVERAANLKEGATFVASRSEFHAKPDPNDEAD